MLIIKYKNGSVEGFQISSFKIDKNRLSYSANENVSLPLFTIETIVVDGVELYRCTTVKF